MGTTTIQKLICRNEVLKFNTCCENVSFLLHGECDVLSLSRSGYLSEYEVKISRSDFLIDRRKKKTQFYQNRIIGHTPLPNFFYYVCPKDLIKVEELPDYAGLIYVDEENLIGIKTAPLMHKGKHDKIKILTKFCRIITERNYLGSCRMTYENKKLKAKREEILKNSSILFST